MYFSSFVFCDAQVVRHPGNTLVTEQTVQMGGVRMWTACVSLPWGMWVLGWCGLLGQGRMCQTPCWQGCPGTAGVPHCRGLLDRVPVLHSRLIYSDASEWASLVA